MRLLIFIALIYLGYRFLKSYWVSLSGFRQQVDSTGVDRIDDVMIKDPFCEVYFPKRNGVRKTINGEEFIFCSKECRDNFIASRSENR